MPGENSSVASVGPSLSGLKERIEDSACFFFLEYGAMNCSEACLLDESSRRRYINTNQTEEDIEAVLLTVKKKKKSAMVW